MTGPDGNLYFTLSNGQVGQITTSGAVTTFTALSIPAAFGVSPGPDGQEWFTDPKNNTIHELGGAAYTIPTANSAPSFLTLGPDSALWFTESGAGRVGRLGVPTHVSPNFPSGVVTGAYSATATAKGGTPPYTWSVSSGSLPPGLSLNQTTGVISGTASTAGSFPFTLQVTDSGTPQPVNSAQTVIIVIANQVGPPPTPLTITSASAPSGVAETAYNFTFTAQGGTAPYTWTATGLPPGLTLSPSGVLSGTPTQPGGYSVSLQVADSSSPALTSSQSFSLTINPLGSAPGLTITTSSAPNGTVGLLYSSTFTAQGGVAPYSWTATGLPAGLSLSTAGVLSGTPTTNGSYSINVQVADSSSTALTSSQTFTLTIVAPSSGSGSGVSITGIPVTAQPLQAITAGLQLNQAYASDVSGTVSITFTGTAAGLPTPYVNPGVCFTTVSSCGATPQTSTTFTIPAGSTVVSLPQILTGTVAGSITVTVAPANLPSVTATVTVPAVAPIIEANSVQITNVTSSGFVVELVASSTPRDVQSVSFTFTAASGAQLTGTSTFTVNVSSLLSQWYSSTEGQSYGSLFSLSVPFTLSGNTSAIGTVYVTLTNSVGTSAVVSGSQ